MKASGIYKIQSIIHPDRIYIGSAIDFKVRWNIHIKTLLRGKHHSKKLQFHYNKYGIDDLVFSIIIECSKENLIAFEQYYIDTLDPYFNINKTAGSGLGYKHTSGALRKIGEASKERTRGPEWRANLSKGHMGQFCSKETREKMSATRKGKSIKSRGPLPKEHKEAISKSREGHKNTALHNLHIKESWIKRKEKKSCQE